jgi:hypothetical protein
MRRQRLESERDVRVRKRSARCVLVAHVLEQKRRIVRFVVEAERELARPSGQSCDAVAAPELPEWIPSGRPAPSKATVSARGGWWKHAPASFPQGAL